jgi:hypothetical protein
MYQQIRRERLTQNKNGIGVQTRLRLAKTVMAQSSPSFVNMVGLTKGNIAAHIERRMTVAAIALAK